MDDNNHETCNYVQRFSNGTTIKTVVISYMPGMTSVKFLFFQNIETVYAIFFLQKLFYMYNMPKYSFIVLNFFYYSGAPTSSTCSLSSWVELNS